MKRAVATFMFELALFGLMMIGGGLIFGGARLIFDGFITLPVATDFIIGYLFVGGGIIFAIAVLVLVLTIRSM